MRHIRLKEWEQGIDFEPAPGAEYRERCNATLADRPVRFRTDGDGFIANGGEPPLDARPVLLLGDSAIENYFVAEDRRLAALLETSWRADGLDVRVINGGVSGMTLLHALGVVLCKALPLRPCAIVYMSGAMDLDACRRPMSFWSDHEYVRPIVSDAGSTTSDDRRRPAPSWTERDRLLDTLVAVAAAHGIALWLVTMPHGPATAPAAGPDDDPETMTALRTALNDATRRYCRDRGVPLVDLDAAIPDFAPLLYDAIHPNEAGTQAMAAVIGRIVRPIAATRPEPP